MVERIANGCPLFGPCPLASTHHVVTDHSVERLESPADVLPCVPTTVFTDGPSPGSLSSLADDQQRGLETPEAVGLHLLVFQVRVDREEVFDLGEQVGRRSSRPRT